MALSFLRLATRKGSTTIEPMPRQIRIEYQGAIYHLLSRGGQNSSMEKAHE
jgi:hypothetical protein